MLTAEEPDHVRTNVMWVVAQVLQHSDPNMDLQEFVGACGVPRRITHNSDGRPNGGIQTGIRTDHESGVAFAPGQPF